LFTFSSSAHSFLEIRHIHLARFVQANSATPLVLSAAAQTILFRSPFFCSFRSHLKSSTGSSLNSCGLSFSPLTYSSSSLFQFI